MLLRYARMAQGNFGDDVNVELWPELFPDLAGRHPDAHLYGVGTLLGARAPTDRRSCWGPAAVNRGAPAPDDSWRVYWVRGPRSGAA